MSTTKITYHDFAALVAVRAGVTSAEADTYIHQLAKSIGHALEGGREVPLYHFGRFLLPHVDERRGRDPSTGEELTIPAHTSVHFRPYSALRIAVNFPFRHLRTKVLTKDGPGRRRSTLALILLGIAIVALLAYGLARRIAARNAPRALPAAIQKVESAPTTAVANAGVLVHRGDSLWVMAASQYGDSAWWPVIYAENKAGLALQNPDLIEVGSAMRMPTLKGSAAKPTAADLTLKSNAYQLVADDYTQLGHPRASEYRAAAGK